jgi:hypothetical protein
MAKLYTCKRWVLRIFTNIDIFTFTVCFKMKIHGEGYDWQNTPIDAHVVCACGDEKAHRR